MPMTVEMTTRTPRTVGVVKLSSKVPTNGMDTIPPTTIRIDQNKMRRGKATSKR